MPDSLMPDELRGVNRLLAMRGLPSIRKYEPGYVPRAAAVVTPSDDEADEPIIVTDPDEAV